MPLNAGQLDRRIVIRQRAAGVDARGQVNGAWTTLATVWAMPMPRAGREFFAASQLQNELGFAWRIRYRTDVTGSMQVTEGGLSYDIQSVVPSFNREWLDLMCIQGVKDGR